MLVTLSEAKGQAPGDTTRARDTLPDLEVRVTRTAEERARLPMAVGILGGAAVRRDGP